MGLPLFTAMALQNLWAAPPPFLWAQTQGTMFPYTNGTLSIRTAVATDQGGNVYVSGGFRGGASFGTNRLVSFGPDAAADVFVAKYDSDGLALWARQAGSELDDNGSGIATDAESNVYVTGYFQDTASFGITNVTSRGNYDVFIAKYNATGTLLWVRTAGGTLRDEGYSLALDGAGNVCIAGSFNRTAAFGPFTLTNVWQDDVFVAKLDKDGNFLWASGGGGISQDFGFGVAADLSGNVYVTGYLQYTGAFGSITVPPLQDTGPSYDIFVAKYDPWGVPVWVRRAGSTSADGGEAVAVDRIGNVYLTGRVAGASVFGSTNLPHGGTFLAKYTNSGEIQWVRLGESGSGQAITCDVQDNVYVAGYGWLSNLGYGSHDILTAKYNPNGTRLWLQHAGSSSWDTGRAIAIDPAYNIYVAGSFRGTDSDVNAQFGSVTLTNTGLRNHDNFVAKLEAGLPLEIHRVEDKIKLHWPPLMTGLSLQRSTNLLQPGGWVTLPNGTNGIELPATDPKAFFRLIR